MSSRNGRKSFHAELPVEVLDAVKEEAEKTGKPMWEVFNDSARMFLGLDEVSTEASVQRHIERLNSEIETLVQEKEAIESEIETKQDRLGGYERKLESIQEQKESYETRLDDILDDLEANKNWKVIARRSTIKDLATDKYGQPNTENVENVIDDLWDRAMDQQREVARYQFSDSTTSTPQAAATDGGSDDDIATKYDFSKANYDVDDDDDDDDPVLMTDGGVDRNKFKNKSRKLARQHFWEKHNREEYTCPDCGRKEDELSYSFEVHHINGEPMDNRPENHVALCRTCHNLREGKKPSLSEIKRLRNQIKNNVSTDTDRKRGKPSVYLAGSMDHESAEHQSWRSSVAERRNNGVYRYTGPTPIKVNSPTEVEFSHGCGMVRGIAGDDMKMIDESDSILAYFNKKEQVGTLTELVYAVTSGKPALVVFNNSLLGFDSENPLWAVGGGHEVEYQHVCPVYWFLINFLLGDGWDGLDAEIEVSVVETRNEIKEAFRNWSWHKQSASELSSKFHSHNGGVTHG